MGKRSRIVSARWSWHHDPWGVLLTIEYEGDWLQFWDDLSDVMQRALPKWINRYLWIHVRRSHKPYH